MSWNALFLILWRQFTSKWGRFFLASGGIMIGIWAITFTTSLSFGLSDTVITAINSQPFAREFQLSKDKNGATDSMNFGGETDFVAIGLDEIERIKADYPTISDYSPSAVYQSFSYADTEVFNGEDGFSCLPGFAEGKLSEEEKTPEKIKELAGTRTENCETIRVNHSPFSNFYDTNKSDWYGSKEKPKAGEIVTCFDCINLNLNEKLGVTSPEEMVGKKITLEYLSVPNYYQAGASSNPSEGDVVNPTSFEESIKEEFTITAVIDDRESGFLMGGSFYVNEDYIFDGINKLNPDFSRENIGLTDWTFVVDDYSQMEEIINNLQGRGYMAASLTLTLVKSVQTLFAGLTAVLGLFGLIALIASIFGIINVMTISILERKKEIGILKALGARNRDIFFVFLFESVLLGVIGWALGTMLAFGAGVIVSAALKTYLQMNPEWQQNLENFDIDSFEPSFPPTLMAATLGLAVFFTALSGLIPAIKAANQRPVDVLRSE